ncbi:MAG: tRNA dihydrouridine synthase DusB, partial [Alphaproteobacteria bacterium]|nr:tRNA dihydrouridine synthase DusB [Alphaproteobacteria bacterium]
RTGVAPKEPSLIAQYTSLTEHLEAMLSYYGEQTGLRIARKHIGWYSKGLSHSAEFRAAVNTCADAEKVRAMIRHFFEPLLEKAG